MILIIDNYDSFTYNLYQALAVLHPDVRVVRNDAIAIDEIAAMRPDGIVLSPGPGRPEDAGICLEAILRFGPLIPLLGVCLGHQVIGLAYGAQVASSPQILHGKGSFVFHNRQGLFRGMPLPFQAGRYHSLAVTGGELEVDAETSDGIIMGVRHKTHPVYGVQFHPESILTPEGDVLLKNFAELCRCKRC